MKKFFLLFAFLLSFISPAFAEVETAWLSNAVVPGEQTRLFIILTDGNIAQQDPLPRVKGASLRWIPQVNYIHLPGSKNKTALLMAIQVTPDEPGTVHIPSIRLRTTGGKIVSTEPQTLTVYPYSAITWNTAKLQGNIVPYGVMWHLSNQTPFVHQPDSCELKIYVPEYISQFNLPTIDNKNVASWRFEPTMNTVLGQSPFGNLLYRGNNLHVFTLHSTLFPLRAGDVSIGGMITAHTPLPDADPIFANFARQIYAIDLKLPELKFKSLELPAGAPASFKNAVGNFSISATTEARDLSANEPITVNITVKGNGNIQSIDCPTLSDASNWKLYPSNKINANQDSRSTSGSVVFQQMIRPIAQTDAIPSFELSYFDPSTKQYYTITTPPIPLEWKASAITGTPNSAQASPAEPPPAGSVPVAMMTDIYSTIPENLASDISTSIHWGWLFLTYIPAIILLALALARKLKQLYQEGSIARQRLHAFKQVSNKLKSDSAADGLKSLGAFIESHIPASFHDESIKQILSERDNIAFQPNTENAAPLSEDKQKQMLQQIKKVLTKLPLLFMGLALVGFAASPVQAASPTGFQAYNQGEYSQAINLLLKEMNSPSLNKKDKAVAAFGIANAYYRMDKPGMAALYYRKALELTPNFTEAQCNLDFIERKEGAVLPPNTRENQWLTYLPYSSLIPITIIAGALTLTFLALLTTNTKHGLLYTTLSTLSGLVVIATLTNYFLYPATPASTPSEKLLIVTSKTPARHAASLNSPSILTLNPSTPLIMRAERGSWIYANTFQNTPVWIPKSSVFSLHDDDSKRK